MKYHIKFMLSILLSLFLFTQYSSGQESSPTTDQPSTPEGQTEFPVDLDFKEADIKDVARAFSRISGINVIVSDEVKAKITLRVQSMNWREALDMIMGAYNLMLVEKQDYIIITTLERRRLAEESGNLQTRVIRLNFVDLAEVQKSLSSILTKRGKIETDVRTNSLIVTDIPEVINKIQEVAIKLDTKTPQVMIEALMLTVKLNNDEKLGIDWDITHKIRSEREFKQSLKIGGTAGTDYLWQIKYGKTLLSWANLSATIELLIEQKRAEILANPRILTLDNLAANIDLTEEVPYTQQVTSTESSSSVSSVQFKQVPVNLSVKPHITKDNFIFMNVKTEQSYRTGYVSGTTQPIIDTRKAETNVLVRDGETMVIGGLRKKEDTITINKLPILGDIPLVGLLFKKTIKTKVDTELLIFVTPRIATDVMLTEKEARQLEKSRDIKTEIKSSLKQATPFPLRAPLKE